MRSGFEYKHWLILTLYVFSLLKDISCAFIKCCMSKSKNNILQKPDNVHLGADIIFSI